VVFAVALVVRVTPVFFMGGNGYTFDSVVYYAPARAIADGTGFRFHHHGEWSDLYVAEPGYSFFLAFWLWMGVDIGKTLLLIQAALGAILAPAIYFYVHRRQARAAPAAALFYALDPLAMGPCYFVLREIFVMALVVATICAIDLAGRFGAAVKAVLLGLGPLSFPVLGFWSIWYWLIDRWQPVDRRRVGLTVVAVSLVVSSSWMVRNMYLSDGNFVFRRHLTSCLLYYTAQYDFPWLPDTSEPGFQKIVRAAEDRYGRYAVAEQKELEKRVLRDTYDLFKADPLRVMWRFIKCNFWFWVEVPGAMGLTKSKPHLHTVLMTFHLVQVILFFAGVWLVVRSGVASAYRFVWSTPLYLAIFIFPFMPIPRYYVALVPLFDIMAGVAIVNMWDRLRDHRIDQ